MKPDLMTFKPGVLARALRELEAFGVLYSDLSTMRDAIQDDCTLRVGHAVAADHLADRAIEVENELVTEEEKP